MLKHFLNLFFPKVCAGCSAYLFNNENVICTVCLHDLSLTNHLKVVENENYKRFYGRIPVELVASMFYFHKKGVSQRIIHHLKYKGCQEIGTFLGTWYAHDLILSPIIQTVDYLIPVPLHKKKMRERGYNQVMTFAEALALGLKIDCKTGVLVRKLYSKSQTKMNLMERNELKKTVFDVNFDDTLHDKHFLIIDDVITTGSTIEACANALLKIPGAKISIVTMAMAQNF